MSSVDKAILKLAEQFDLNGDAADSSDEECGLEDPVPVKTKPKADPPSNKVVEVPAPMDRKVRAQRIYYLTKRKKNPISKEEAIKIVDDPNRKPSKHAVPRKPAPRKVVKPIEKVEKIEEKVEKVVEEVEKPPTIETPQPVLPPPEPVPEPVPVVLEPPKLERQRGYYTDPMFSLSCR